MNSAAAPDPRRVYRPFRALAREMDRAFIGLWVLLASTRSCSSASWSHPSASRRKAPFSFGRLVCSASWRHRIARSRDCSTARRCFRTDPFSCRMPQLLPTCRLCVNLTGIRCSINPNPSAIRGCPRNPQLSLQGRPTLTLRCAHRVGHHGAASAERLRRPHR
jgi:hypothetical protein